MKSKAVAANMEDIERETDELSRRYPSRKRSKSGGNPVPGVRNTPRTRLHTRMGSGRLVPGRARADGKVSSRLKNLPTWLGSCGS